MANIVILRGTRHCVEDCITCGVVFTVPERMRDHAYQEGGFFHCPNGHSQGWHKNGSESERVRRERDRLKQQIAQKNDEIARQREEREAAERRVSAAKGQITKLKNRAKAGVCPCCNRTFQNLQRHMASKHPEFDPKVVDLEKEKAARA